MMNIILTGGTGFIGRAVRQKLIEAGHKIILLTRNPESDSVKWLNKNFVQVEGWDGKALGPWAEKVDVADAIINLAGENIAAKRWTVEQKKRIFESRIDATRALVWAIEKAAKKPSVLVNASAVGYYGNVDEGDVDENAPKGTGFLSDTCGLWESEALRAKHHGVRVVLMRFGVVLGEGGGALSKMIPPFRMFLGGSIGSGRQWFPWVHRDDVAGAILFALDHAGLSGPVNVTAPEAVRMSEFSKALGRAMHRPSWAPVPALALKLLLGEMSEMLLAGQKAIPKKLLEAGFQFNFPRLDQALRGVR